MKKIIFHSAAILISILWLIMEYRIYDPLSLKGAVFLKFYLILLLGFYISILATKLFKETISKTTIYFAIFILLVGIAKLIKGLILGKPVGYLLMIIILEMIAGVIIMSFQFNQKIK